MQTVRPGAAAAQQPVVTGVGLSKPQRKTLASLGHHVDRLAAACDRLRTQADSFPQLAPWLQTRAAGADTLLPGSGHFGCFLTLDQNSLLLHPALAAAGQTEAAFASFHLPQVSFNPARTSAALNDPLWTALLRLRPLRDFWERELRRATHDALLAILPDAWLLDPTPLPPGAVIPRLEIPSWDEFDRADRTRRDFIPSSGQEITALIAQHPAAPGVLLYLPKRSPGAVSLISIYSKQDSRVDWLGAVAQSQPIPAQPTRKAPL